jgi:dCMP deaminase
MESQCEFCHFIDKHRCLDIIQANGCPQYASVYHLEDRTPPRTGVVYPSQDEAVLPWDVRFMELARFVAQWSKDPSTKVGAVIVDAQRRVRGIGYNGFPRGVEDSLSRLEDREEKLRRVVHAEANAILNSSSTEGCTIYVWPLFSCSTCAGLIIQAGIQRVVSPPPLEARWQSAYDAAAQMYGEAGVEVVHINV